MAKQEQTAQQEILSKTDCYMHWWMNRRCNFDCAYCFREPGDDAGRAEDPACKRYGPGHIFQRFRDTGKVWLIYMTGGEPLLYPNFVELATELTRSNYISVSTNLSTPNAYELAQAVSSDRVFSIIANIHILEREKIKGGTQEFLRKFLYFQEQGFNIRLAYVAYPPLFGRIKQDLERLRGEGARQIAVKVFQGRHDGKRYPRDYSDDERAFIRSLGLNDSEENILARHAFFLGRKCDMGYSAFHMDVAGNVTRCSTLKNEYGNLFAGTFRPGQSARRCTAGKCVCSYQGMKFASAAGSVVPPNIIVRPLRCMVSVGEWIDSLRGKAIK